MKKILLIILIIIIILFISGCTQTQTTFEKVEKVEQDLEASEPEQPVVLEKEYVETATVEEIEGTWYSCDDSDEINYLQRGTTEARRTENSELVSKEDFCDSRTILIEHYCEGNNPQLEEVDCSNILSICENGICVE